MSTPPRRPSQPASQTRTSYQVGRPWMLLGKMLRGLTGTPMRRMARANSSLAEAEPEPLTLANLTTKSLMASMRLMQPPDGPLRGRPRPLGGQCAKRAWGLSCHLLARGVVTAGRPGLGRDEQELLHVPGPRRAALGAQAAMQADVL